MPELNPFQPPASDDSDGSPLDRGPKSPMIVRVAIASIGALIVLMTIGLIVAQPSMALSILVVLVLVWGILLVRAGIADRPLPRSFTPWDIPLPNTQRRRIVFGCEDDPIEDDPIDD